MTLSQAFIFKQGGSISATDANTVLEFAGLTPTDTYNPNDQLLKCKFYDALLGYLSQDNVGIKSISEGGYTIVYDMDQKAKHLERLAKESGCDDLVEAYTTQPVIQNKSYMW